MILKYEKINLLFDCTSGNEKDMPRNGRSSERFLLFCFTLTIIGFFIIVSNNIENVIYKGSNIQIRLSNNEPIQLEYDNAQVTYDIVYSTFIGGSQRDIGQSIAVDNQNCIYVTGSTDSSDFLNLSSDEYEIQGQDDCFLLKFDSTGTELVYAVIIGGIGRDEPSSIYVDQFGCAYVAGRTSSLDFPVVNGVNDTPRGSGDCFVFKVSSDGKELLYSSVLGGSEDDFARDIAVDSEGCVYIAGTTFCTNGGDFDFPIVNPYDDTWNGNINDGFVLKLNAEGDALIYSTIIGGYSGEWCESIAVDSQGNAIVTGFAESADFPMVNAFDDNWSSSEPNVPDCILFKLNSSGNGLLWSTYVGGNGSDYARSVSLDTSGDIYVTGATNSHDFPTVGGYESLFQGGWSDSFVFKMTSDGKTLLYSSFFGGSDYDEGRSIALDNNDIAYITGFTTSTNFPLKNPISSQLSGAHDCFIIKIDTNRDSILLSTFYGGVDDERAYSICVDLESNIYVTGTTSSSDYISYQGIIQSYMGGESDCFILKLGDTSTSVYSVIAIFTLIVSIICISVVLFRKFRK